MINPFNEGFDTVQLLKVVVRQRETVDCRHQNTDILSSNGDSTDKDSEGDYNSPFKLQPLKISMFSQEEKLEGVKAVHLEHSPIEKITRLIPGNHRVCFAKLAGVKLKILL